MGQRVWVMYWYTAEPYEDYSGVHMVFGSLSAAKAYLEVVGKGPHYEAWDEDQFEGYFLSLDEGGFSIVE